MAYSQVATPGSQLGPCETACVHVDCAEARRTAETPCGICTRPIGFERNYAKDTDGDGTLAHFLCLLDKYDTRGT